MARRAAAERRADRLATYRAKRRFDATPEPRGDAPPKRPAAAALTFCVQKHLASHLHYDFRLEHDGVLLSWAVPKGPSLKPADKRLAMRTEDHPLDYGGFEGVIPEGYGAGIVLLWDRGTWAPEPGFEDIGRAVEEGELKFRLDGVKLKGSWVLVRTRGRASGRAGDGDGESRSWLLIKHRDEWAGDLDITTFAPRSVKSDGDFVDVLAQENPGVWESNRPAKSGQAGAMFRDVIRRAVALRREADSAPAPAPPAKGTKKKPRRKAAARTGRARKK